MEMSPKKLVGVRGKGRGTGMRAIRSLNAH